MKLVLLLVGLTTFWFHPTQFRCPPGWWLPEGIRRNGRFVCRPGLVGGYDDPAGGAVDRSVQPEGAVYGNIYCTGGSVPIIVDERTVGCQHTR